MKLGIAGAGKIVLDLLSFIHEIPNLSVIALCGTSRSYEKLEHLQQQYRIPAIYTDYDKMLEDDLDTVYIGLPNHLHYSFARKALLQGKHVICEKPFTSNLREFLELDKLARERGLMLLEAVTTIHLPNYQSLKERVGLLGDIKIVQCNFSQYSSRYDAFKAGNTLPAFDPAMSGGALMDINIYNIHWVTGLFGSPERVQYMANIERGIDTSGVLLLDYGHFKAVCVGAKDSSTPAFYSIQGDKGSIQMNSPANICDSYTYTLQRQEPEKVDHKNHAHRMYDEFVEFERIIAQQDTQAAESLLEHSRRVMEIVQAARESAGVIFAADHK
ncbi:Gfo/Idh/MocA family protein [Paenibacillus macerans]|uniref:Gfo/Idh/MocA family protein n=1 Tax=Paenibacillus macerans TaxID=44252 RepID=UPI00203B62EA|nr:Gfo/Idh/MocA family oxidoreductase [Paenibacillus macerans]MCM3703138.1 Gfo/Idh/MocA family oxidoreductase [Paenibacillus macerans]